MNQYYSVFAGAFDASVPTVLTFLVNYWIHSSVFLLAAFIAVRLRWLKADASGEIFLKAAMVLGVFSALGISLRPAVMDNIWHIQETSQYSGTQQINIQPDTDSQTSLLQRDNATGQGVSQVDSSHGLNNKDGEDSQSMIQSTEQSANPESLSRISFWLVFYWGVGVIIMLAMRCYQRYQLHRMMQHKVPLKDVMLLSGLASLKQRAGYKRDINLYASSILTSPVVLNSKDIVLPEVFVTQYSSAQQQAALAHEMAHLKRKDMHWQWLFQTFDILFFFQPFNKLIHKEIYQTVELRADDMASQWTGDPRALAEAISVTAKQQLGTKHTQWVLAMKCEKSNLLVRVENLLKGGVAKTKVKTIAALTMLWSVFLLCAPGISLSVTAPAVAALQPSVTSVAEKTATPTDANARSSSGSDSFSFSEVEDDYGVGNINISYSTDDTSWALTSKLTGKIRFNEEETEIVYFPEDSELDVRIDDGKNKRRLNISREKGQTEYSYHMNRHQRSIGDDPEWLARFILELLRMTGWNAKERIEKIYAKGGLIAVLDEIQLIKGERPKANYLILLPELKTFTSQEVNLVFQALTDINSDFHKSRTVRSLFRSIRFEGEEWFTDSNWQTLLDATHDVESDMEMARVMRSVVMAVPLESQMWPAVFAQLQTVQSDFELAKLLRDLISHRPLQQVQLRELLQLTSTIESDFELSGLLIHLSEHSGVPESVANEWLESATTLQSDFEMSRTLKARVATNMSSAELVQLIRLASREIQSDFELASVFKVLIEKQDVAGIVKDEMYDSLSDIQSDHERNAVIKELEALDI